MLPTPARAWGGRGEGRGDEREGEGVKEQFLYPPLDTSPNFFLFSSSVWREGGREGGRRRSREE